MDMEKQLQADLTAAMKERKETDVAALRGIKTAIMQLKTSPNFKGDRDSYLSDLEVIKLIQKLVKEREESAEIYIANGREDLAEKEVAEAEVMKAYLPEPLSEEKLAEIVSEKIKETGATGIKDMGKVIGCVTKSVGGQADGRTISTMVKKLLLADGQ